MNMRMITSIALLFLLITASVQAQTTYASQDTIYRNAVENALLALKQGDCEGCLRQYERAFSISQNSTMSTLRAATCAYQCGQTEQAKAFLKRAVSLDWLACESMWNTPGEIPRIYSTSW